MHDDRNEWSTFLHPGKILTNCILSKYLKPEARSASPAHSWKKWEAGNQKFDTKNGKMQDWTN